MGIEKNQTIINIDDATGQINNKLNEINQSTNNTEANTNQLLVEETQTQAAIQDVQDLLQDVDDEVDNINVDVHNINANVIHVIQKTDPLPSDPASESVISNLINSVQSAANAIKLVTDNLPDSGALTSIAQAANTALQATLLLVKAKTDNLPASPANETTLNNATYGLNALKTLIGAATDDETVNSLFGKLYILEKHAHGQTFLYPSGQDALQITKASGVWAAFPTPNQIIPANAITHPFDLHFVYVTGISANGEYEIGIYEGAPGAEILRHIWPATRTSVQSQEGSNPSMSLYFAANTRISVALRGNPNATESLRVKIAGHEY